MQVQVLLLLLMAFLLPPRAGAGEIIGGKEARPHSRPYMAYVEIQRGNNVSSCGGFLVSENFVLTAAHCQADSIHVALGAHNMRRREPSWQVLPVQRQIPHPQYNRETLNNDIMLLQLTKPVKLNRFVNTIPLPEANEQVEPGTPCSVAGWGRTIANDASSAADVLQEVDVEVVEDKECSKYTRYKAVTMLCAGQPRKGKDSAQGDSGGPLVCGDKAQGIVSWGKYTPPGVYTRVSTYSRWIKKTMRRG